MLLKIFENVEGGEKKEAIEHLIRNSSPSQDYFLMVILSVSMATIGVLLDSIIILIGSMLIAPVLYPVLGIGMGLSIFNFSLVARSAYTILQSLVVSLLFAVFISLFFKHPEVLSFDLVHAFTNLGTYIMYSIVALIAGLAASFSLVKPELSDSFPGIVISVSLVPPLAIAGIAGTQGDGVLAVNMLLIFGSNIASMIIASGIVFSLMNFYVGRRVAEKTIKEEQEEIKEENE